MTRSQSKQSGYLSFCTRIFTLAVALGMAAFPALAGAQVTHVVDQDGSGAAGDCDAAAPAFTSIQSAVNAAAPGDTIFICPGSYDEQVVVTTADLAIRGSGAASTVLRPAVVVQNTVRPGTTLPVAPIVLVDGVDGVTLANLAIDGGAADSGAAIFVSCGGMPIYAGVYFRNGSGSVEKAHVTRIRSATVCPFAIVAHTDQSGAGPVADVRVANTLVDRYGVAGILCSGENTVCTVTGSTIRGEGPVSNVVQLGIAIRAESGGHISGNTITDHFFLPRSRTAVGIFLSAVQPDTNRQLLRDNVFANNQVDVERFAAAAAFD